MRAVIALLLAASAVPTAFAGTSNQSIEPIPASRPYRADTGSGGKSVAVPFWPHSTRIGPAAQRALLTGLPNLRGAAQVVITGCGDPQREGALPARRAAAVHAWLSKHGIDEQLLVDAIGSEPASTLATKVQNCRVAGSDRLSVSSTQNIQPTDIASALSDAAPTAPDVLQALSSTRPTTPNLAPQNGLETAPKQLPPQALTAPTPERYVPPAAPSLSTTQSSSTLTQLDMVNKVLDLVAHGQVKSEDTAAIIAQIMNYHGPVQPPLSPAQAAPVGSLAGAIVPTPSEPALWRLSVRQSLRETLTTWSAQAGWNAPLWQASHSFQISRDDSVTGSFSEAVSAVRNSVSQLEIREDTTSHRLVISDATK